MVAPALLACEPLRVYPPPRPPSLSSIDLMDNPLTEEGVQALIRLVRPPFTVVGVFSAICEYACIAHKMFFNGRPIFFFSFL